MIRALETAVIDLPCEAVTRLFLDYAEWPGLFPETIRGVRLVERLDRRLVLEVDHREGRVRNVVTVWSPEEIVVEEWKRRYAARFTYRFLGAGVRTRFVLEGEVRLRLPYTLVEPLLTPVVRRQMRKLVIEPLKKAAER